MTDDRRRVQEALARLGRRDLDRQDAVPAAVPAAGSGVRRHVLQARAKRTRAHIAAARARRRQGTRRSS